MSARGPCSACCRKHDFRARSLMSTLVAFGNLERPFDRMARCVLQELNAMPGPVVIQAGASHLLFRDVPSHVSVFQTCGFDEFERLVRSARVVITHGGAGTIHAAVSCGLRPAVFVRQGILGEHIDNHQVEWCETLFSAGLGEKMLDRDSLGRYLAKGEFMQRDCREALKFFDSSVLRADLHGYIRAVLAGE